MCRLDAFKGRFSDLVLMSLLGLKLCVDGQANMTDLECGVVPSSLNGAALHKS